MNDLEFSVTNLSKLPDAIGEKWHALSVLYIDTEMHEVPASLFQIPVIVLSLMGNQIKYPLQVLPANVGLGAYVVYLNVEESNISSLPSWATTNVGLPFGRASPYWLNVSSDKPYKVDVGCVVPDPRGGGRIPMTVIDSKLAL